MLSRLLAFRWRRRQRPLFDILMDIFLEQGGNLKRKPLLGVGSGSTRSTDRTGPKKLEAEVRGELNGADTAQRLRTFEKVLGLGAFDFKIGLLGGKFASATLMCR